MLLALKQKEQHYDDWLQVQLINFLNIRTKEAGTENNDRSYTIFIEISLLRDAQQEAFKHVTKHIRKIDSNKSDADKIGFDAHSAWINKIKRKGGKIYGI